MSKIVRLILGDQLNYNHSWFKEVNDDVTYIMMESYEEATYVKHHIQKLVGFFLAMRQFGQHLKKNGHRLVYFKLLDAHNHENFWNKLNTFISKNHTERAEFLAPDEYRVDFQLNKFLETLTIPYTISSTEHFYTNRNELKKQFEGKKTYLMESFYRAMRVKHNVLMEEDKKTPLTGKWNYDADNRKKLPENFNPPPPLMFNHDVTEIVEMIKEKQIDSIGKIDVKQFSWPANRTESLQLLQYFCDYLLPQFGNYQDAMHSNYWSIFHSRLSFSMNVKMLSPKEVVDAAIDTWKKNQNNISFSQIEGFVRQILGWREYMRGIYWAKMPEFATLNYFDHKNKLPEWFWTGKTKMNCLHHAINQSLEYAYAHHIQRLMITGNFALLAGINPDEVDQWYLGIYMDALEWVEITNTRGMSQFADGGIVGTKPYVSSANYIDKMSNYCKGCHYDKTLKTGSNACPFNSLYWHFYERNRALLQNNSRIGTAYLTLNKMNNKEDILKQANYCINNLDKL